MTRVIDSLVLEFGLDHKQFLRTEQEVFDQLKKMEDEAQKAGNSVEAQQKRSNDLFASFRREMIGTLSLLIGGYGVKEFVGYITNLDASTSRLARTMDMSTRELSAWQGAAKQVGGSGESITSTLQGMTRDMNSFMLTGQGTLASVLRPLGISLFDNNKHLKTASDLFLELADAVQKMDPARAAAFLSMIPGMNQDSINLILEGRKAIEEMIRAQKDLGTTTDLSAEEAKKYQQEMAKLDTAATNLGRRMLMFVAPAITKAMNDITQSMRQGLNPQIAKGSFFDMLFNKSYALSGAGFSEMWGDLKGAFNYGANYDPAMADARQRLAAGMNAQAANRALDAVRNGPVGGGDNWDRFLRGLSYLETNQQDVGNPSSTARGYFQFINGTAAQATRAGLPDPRAGGYDDQARATRMFIERFHPDAAAAISRGDFAGASQILNGTWPSLPGGSQQQNPNRYTQWADILRGQGAGGSTSTRTTTVTIGNMNVTTPDARTFAKDIKPELERGSFSSQFNSGMQ